MPRFEVRFYDAVTHVKVTVELDAADPFAAESAAQLYLRSDLCEAVARFGLLVGAVRQVR